MTAGAGIASELFRASLRELLPYEPGKPVEELQRELGLERVVKLASNEGAFGPFPAALEAMRRSAVELNRYPDGGSYRLRAALAERHGVRFEEIAPGPGADAIVDCLSQAMLDPGDEIVCGWPTFPSYVLYARKMGATARTVPLTPALAYDLDAILAAIGPRTKIVYLCHPNNPTGVANSRAELEGYFAQVPEHVLTVVDQAYFEYAHGPDYPDAVEEHFKAGRRAAVLRTFSKVFGLAGLRVGYAVASADVVTAVGKVRRAFDLSAPAQEAALASLGDAAEIARRLQANTIAIAELTEVLGRHGYAPASGSVTNFVYVEVGQDAAILFEALLRQGVIVRPLRAFGAPEAIRVTAGTAEDHAFLDRALSAVAGGARPG